MSGVSKGVTFTLPGSSRILPCSLVEVMKGIVLGKQADFEFVTGDIKEGGVGLKNLTENVRSEVLEA